VWNARLWDKRRNARDLLFLDIKQRAPTAFTDHVPLAKAALRYRFSFKVASMLATILAQEHLDVSTNARSDFIGKLRVVSMCTDEKYVRVWSS